MISVSSPALRPSHPHGCRKRAFRQGHALRGRFAGLDVHALASGLIHSRATDEEASGGGFVKGSSQARNTKTTTQKSVSCLSRFSRIPTRGGHDTCKPAPAHTPQDIPGIYAVTVRHALKYPHRHAHYADHTSSRTLAGGVSYGAQALAAYRFPMSRMLTRYRRHAHQRRVGYDSVPHPIRTCHIPDARIMRPCFCADACTFVRHCLRGPAYVSYRRSASYFTAGEGRRPFEPRKAQRQEKR